MTVLVDREKVQSNCLRPDAVSSTDPYSQLISCGKRGALPSYRQSLFGTRSVFAKISMGRLVLVIPNDARAYGCASG